MNPVNEVRLLIAQIPKLKNLPYENMDFTKWENTISELLRRNSHYRIYYKRFLDEANYAYWRPGKADPRGSASTPQLYQREYQQQIERYRALLEDLYSREKETEIL